MPAVTARTARRRPLAADGGCPRRTRIPADRPPHPYGVKPLGNLLLAGAAPDCRAPGLGTLAALTDELLLVLLADYLAPGDICRLALASRALCVLARHDELWRTLVVRRFAPSGSFRHHRTWLETYATCHLAARVGAARNFGPDAVAELQRGGLDERSSGVGAPRDVSTAAVRTVVRHVPIPVRGFYSDYLYHSHVCATLPFAPYAVAGGGNAIDRRSGLSLHDFVEEYEKPGRPVIITDVVSGWPAYAKWDREYLVANYRTTLFAAEAAELRLDDYLAYADSQRDEAPLYLFDKHFGERCPGLAEEFEVPVYFREDLFRHLGSERPDYRWLIIGPERSGSTFHKDPNATSAWNGVIRGAKKWIMFPPDVLPPGVFTNDDESDVTSPVNLAEWFVNFYEVMKSCWTGRRQPLEGVCRSGELMFVPAGWWHAVINLEFSVAVTQNYVSRWNLAEVLRFLRDKPDQISGLPGGCRDDPEVSREGGRDASAEKSGTYAKFVRALEEREPELLAEARAKLAEEEERRREAERRRKAPTKWERLLAENGPDGQGAVFRFAFGPGDETPADDANC